ncbi:FAD synthase-like isoform X2 [Hermetia illucens]|uniref:FAD synthase-like isoform X2 n=1 Tax=Hermetia illucens TaxID=343691 RepID=UPI0018CC2C8C|nr:FAD synthase-like isoform X2 [Hermetia illucens]
MKQLKLVPKKHTEVIADSTQRYGPEEVFIAFNGGKDCTVLLDLYIKYSKHNAKPIVIYIQSENPFKEVDDFIRTCEIKYDINIEFAKGKLKPTLEQLCSKNPRLGAVVMGSRRTDPHCDKLETFQYTDPGWPKLLRINPILDWNYKDIWDYIRLNKIEYCKLYDEGYTSIGDRKNTKPNEHLLLPSNDGSRKYKRPWELDDNSFERAGRF